MACKNGDMQARDQLIQHNLRLVAHIVKKYHIATADVEDFISIGTIGLMKAIDSFQIDKGIRLATYASCCIENEMLMVFRSEKKLSCPCQNQSDRIGMEMKYVSKILLQ